MNPESTSTSAGKSTHHDTDLYMPITNVICLMKHPLPEKAKIADDAKEAIQECISEFITLITSEANKKCHGEYRNTVTPDDVISAMKSLGFDNYIEPLTIFLKNHQAQAQDPDREPVNNRGRRVVTAPMEPPTVPEPPAPTNYYVPPSPPPPASTSYCMPPSPPPTPTGYYVPPPPPPPAPISYFMPPPPSPPAPTDSYVPEPLPTTSTAAYEVDHFMYIQQMGGCFMGDQEEFNPFE